MGHQNWILCAWTSIKVRTEGGTSMSCCHLLEEFALRFWELRDLGDTIGLWLGFFPV